MTFIPITYQIAWRLDGASTPRTVKGYAFEIPGWPEFHCCVRFGNRFTEHDLFDDWIIDHYESGTGLSEAGKLKRRQDAPEAMRKVLDAKGKECVHKALREYGLEAF